jgi:integrase/recombinase XerD
MRTHCVPYSANITAMLNLYRRHIEACSHRSRTYRKCACPIWVQGTLEGRALRKSLNLRNWESAQQLVRDWESGGGVKAISLETACDRFYADCEVRGLGTAQLGKYKLLVEELKKEFGSRVTPSVSIDDLRRYRERWKVAPVTAQKKLERLRTFFRFCHDSGWISKNPAKVLKSPKVSLKPTLPFSDDEIEKVLWACEQYPDLYPQSGEYAGKVKPFVLLLEYSGLRIRDAVCLRCDALKDGKILLRTAKTGTAVWIPLPKVAIEALKSIRGFGTYFFWSGNGLPKSAVADWQRTLAKVFKAAGIQGHAHRFRDTFSVNLLQKGVSLETVSVLLGHSNTKITAKHYNPWVQSRQQALENEISKAWSVS